MRAKLQEWAKAWGIYSQVQRFYMKWRHFRHYTGRNWGARRRIVSRYVASTPTRKLHISCGERVVPGWLNTDIYHGNIYLDARARLPIASDSFHAVYSHHFIEHITFEELMALLAECYRILLPSGRIRLVTPDLEKILKVVEQADADMIAFFCAEDVIRNKAMLFNRLVLNQGEHKLIYDLETLKRMLETVGFRDVVAYPYTYSDDSMFKGMDNHGYLYIGEVSLCIEATK